MRPKPIWQRVRGGDLGDPHAHLRQQHKPAPPVTHLTRGAEFWSAISGGLLLALVAGLVYFRPAHWIWWLMGVGFGFFALEAVARGYLSSYLLNVSVLLAIVSAVLLLFKFWKLAILVAIVALVSFMIRENLRELRFSGKRSSPPTTAFTTEDADVTEDG